MGLVIGLLLQGMIYCYNLKIAAAFMRRGGVFEIISDLKKLIGVVNMKVKFTSMMKDLCTVSELPIVHEMINLMRDDTGLKEYAAIAARLAGRDNVVEVLKAESEIAKNYRVYNRYTDNSRDFDIWLKVYAFVPCNGFYIIGAYLSDIWDLTTENANNIRELMYIREYTENE